MEQNLNHILEQQLRGLHLPEAVGWWPLAPGWWLLIVLGAVLIATAIWLFILNTKKNRYRRLAIAELETIYKQWTGDQQNALYIQSVNALLKRAIISAGGHSLPISVSGIGWAKSLNDWAKKPLPEQTLSALANAGYQANPDVDIHALNRQIETWLVEHKRPDKNRAAKEPGHA